MCLRFITSGDKGCFSLYLLSLTHTHGPLRHTHPYTHKPFSFTTPSLFVRLWEEIETGTRKTALFVARRMAPTVSQETRGSGWKDREREDE